MKGLVKSGVVLAGYIAAFVAAYVALEIRLANTSGPDAQASAGMNAFGDLFLFFGVFGTAAIVPTALALFFLRLYRFFWIAFSIAAVAFAATGVAATAVFIAAHYWAAPHSLLEYCAALSVLRMLPAPVFASIFVIAVFIARDRASRWMLIVAPAMEGAVAMYTLLHWFVGCCHI